MRISTGSMALLLAGVCGCATGGGMSPEREAVVRQLREKPLLAESVVDTTAARAAIPASGEAAETTKAAPVKRYSFNDCRNGCIDVSLETADDFRFLDEYLRSIAKRIHLNLVFPWESVQKGPDGEVEVTLKIDRKGRLLSHEIARRSGTRILDEAALASVGRSAPFSPFPSSPYVANVKIRSFFRYSP